MIKLANCYIQQQLTQEDNDDVGCWIYTKLLPLDCCGGRRAAQRIENTYLDFLDVSSMVFACKKTHFTHVQYVHVHTARYTGMTGMAVSNLTSCWPDGFDL
jgi:hypothetical protein